MRSTYVDGFLLTVPKKKLAAYKRLAVAASKIWRKHGALAYRECVGDDLDVHMGVPFPKIAKPKKGETVFFSYIEYKSRKHRDAVNKKVMADPKLAASMDMNNLPFDCKRMSYGGFKILVQG
jgi:uncharacterized protein YbaA (DUF1428 family)